MSPPRTRSSLERPVQYLKGVGPKRARSFSRIGVNTAGDLLYHVPRRYEDASTVAPISSLEVGTDATVIGEVVSKGVIPTRKGLRIFQAVLRDESGLIECAWPGQPFLDRSIRKGDVLLVTGPVRFFHGRQLQPREYVALGRAEKGDSPAEGAVLPIYPATEGLSQRVLRGIIDRNLDALREALPTEDPLPGALREQAGVPPLREAVRMVHRPDSLEEAERGRRRLAYEELFFLQLLHARARRRVAETGDAITFRRTNELLGPIYRGLPFELTDAQTRAVREIFDDMTDDRRMNRLLQGDVGSGKTVVALLAMALAAESGYQSALMVPTEVLAEQHLRTLRSLIGDAPLRVELLTGRVTGRDRRVVLQAIESGEVSVVVGTQALIQEGVRFHRLGLAVADEQHRFGVRQRMELAGAEADTDVDMDASGARPDVLVMSATPIPRSLALTLYGDLDLSVLDERPPGRRPLRTAMRKPGSRARVYDFIRKQVRAGRQAYIVYPLVEASEKMDLRAATEEHARLREEVFPDLCVGLVHGRMAGGEKEDVMRAFTRGDIDVLVSTTVIEVGIDVPNATVMVIEHAERFGLSQLHQLRGRVGRGADASYCILIAPDDGETAERLTIFTDTDDGFEIARADLRIRGMGDFFGARQHGLPAFRYCDFERDGDLLRRARSQAAAIVADDPELKRREHASLLTRLRERFGERERMYEVG
ncbi:MAG: ATP-dependent DNA helicase RecG [Gemmatimonadota bacterium]